MRKLGDKVADELVNWFNQVDATYRSDLKQINELNFSRFDAKLEQRFAESDARMEQRFAESDTRWERRFAELDTKWDHRITELDANLDHRITELDAKWELRWAQLDTRFTALEQRFTTALANQRAELIRWMFLGWVTMLGAMIGLAKGVFG